MPQYSEAGEVLVKELRGTFSTLERFRQESSLRVGDRAGELARVGATKSELAIRGGLLSSGLKRNSNNLGGNGTLLKQVVGDYGEISAPLISS